MGISSYHSSNGTKRRWWLKWAGWKWYTLRKCASCAPSSNGRSWNPIFQRLPAIVVQLSSNAVPSYPLAPYTPGSLVLVSHTTGTTHPRGQPTADYTLGIELLVKLPNNPTLLTVFMASGINTVQPTNQRLLSVFA